MRKILFILIFLGLFGGASLAKAAGPVLHFSDLTSGPKTGLGDGLGSGAIVTIWGVNLGGTQGTSKVYVGGVEAAYVYEWTNATQHAGHPADLYTYHKMQTIAFSVPATAVDGANTIKVVVNGVTSNTLPFTIRTGNIYHVKTTGSNSNAGSYAYPWLTMEYATWARVPAGSIVYFHDGLQDTDGLRVSGNVGSPDNHIAFIAYPGASVLAQSSSFGIGNDSASNSYVVFSKLTAKSDCIEVTHFPNSRFIALELTDITSAACSDGAMSGAARQSGSKYYGLYAHDHGGTTSGNQTHVFYFSVRGWNGYHLIDAFDFGWNVLKDNQARAGINIFDEHQCGGYNGTVKIHDNFVINQTGLAIVHLAQGCDPGWQMSGNFEIYNNVFVNCGQNGVYPGQDYRGETITLRGDTNVSNVKLYNNTIYNYGDAGVYSFPIIGAPISVWANYGAWNFAGTWEFKNNLIIDRKNIPFSYDAYMKVPTSSSNNLWYSTTSGHAGPPSWDTTPLTSNPQFTNPSTGDFHLQSSSPAIDAGISLISTVANDIEGITRPQGLAFDIGAYEYATSTPPPPPPPLKGDFNSDSKVNDSDFALFKNAFKSIFNSIFDLNNDSVIDVKDLGVLMSSWLP